MSNWEKFNEEIVYKGAGRLKRNAQRFSEGSQARSLGEQRLGRPESREQQPKRMSQQRLSVRLPPSLTRQSQGKCTLQLSSSPTSLSVYLTRFCLCGSQLEGMPRSLVGTTQT